MIEKVRSQADNSQDLARQIRRDKDEVLFEGKVKRTTPSASKREEYRIDFAKAGGGITAHPWRTGFPVLATMEEMRAWMADHGYSQVYGDPDRWATTE